MSTKAADAVIPPEKAGSHIGESVEIEGRVEQVVCSPQACLLSFQPGFSGLVVAIPAAEVGDPSAIETLESRTVRVRGRVSERGGRPRIELPDASSLGLAEADGRAEAGGRIASPASTAGARQGGAAPDGASPAIAPRAVAAPPPLAGNSAGNGPKVEVRVDGGLPTSPGDSLRDAVQQLTGDEMPAPAGDERAVHPDVELRLVRQDLARIASRLDDIEGRFEEMAERLAVLEEMAMVQPETSAGAGSVPGYIVSGSESPTLRRVGRGWSVERVVRLHGEPTHVTGHPPGPYTWYYDGGRMLTVSERGRVLSAVGF